MNKIPQNPGAQMYHIVNEGYRLKTDEAQQNLKTIVLNVFYPIVTFLTQTGATVPLAGGIQQLL
jgi:hypothetical protein